MLYNIIQAKIEREKRKERINQTENILLGFTTGFLAGTAFGYLFAPRSGKETREMICNQSKKICNNTKQNISLISNKTSDFAENTIAETKSLKENVKEDAKEKIKEIKKEFKK